jgi:endonuclease/exonuclease/phosphatase (EEP) superfamily protein YafD
MPVTREPRTQETHGGSSPSPQWSARRITLVVASAVVVAAAIATVTWPQAFGLHRAFGVAQLIAFRPALVIGFAAAALIIGGIALMTKRTSRRIILVIASVFLVAALGQAAVQASRGWGSAFSPSAGDIALAQGDLTVLSWNTQGGATSSQEIAELALALDPDVIALPETDAVAADEVRAILAENGISMTASTVGDRIPTSVLISTELGNYRLDESRGSTPGLPSGVWRPDDDVSPAIVVAHPLPPLPASMSEWRDGLDWVAEQCGTLGPGVIVAGDLGALPGCSDAAMAASAAASGTWPSTMPQAIASPIDHVLVGADWATLDARVIETSGQGSDHRPIVAVLRH